MISNKQVVEQAQSVLTNTIPKSGSEFFRIDATFEHLLERTHVWRVEDAYRATAYRFLECWCYIFPELFENLKVKAKAIGIELSDISSPEWFINTWGTVTIEHLLTFTADDREVSVWVRFCDVSCVQKWTNEHDEEAVPDYDTAADYIFNTGSVKLNTDYEEVLSVSHLDNKPLKEVFLGLLEAVEEALL